ncbi:MAG: metallopeptidase family protein [Solirubrobacterales bacterium]
MQSSSAGAPVLGEDETRSAAVEALDSLPRHFRDELGEVAVIVEDSHPEGIMGIYDPIGELHRIVIFRDANPNLDEVRRTVLHEVGHYFGMGEEQLEELGYG